MSELTLIMKATLILAAALACVRMMSTLSAAARSLVLVTAFAVLLVLPVASLIIPTRAVAVPIPEVFTSAAAVRVASPAGVPAGGPEGLTATASRRRLLDRAPSPGTVMRSVWAMGTTLLMLRAVLPLWRVRRIRLEGVPWPFGTDAIEGLVRRAGIRRRVEIFSHPDLLAPMTCGLLRPAIGLPVGAQEWPATELRRALIHELEHVRRADWPVLLMARIGCILYWFNPLAWIAARQLRIECEHACDDAVVRSDEHIAYAQQLVSLAKRLAEHPPVPLLSIADGSSLAKRIDAVLDTSRPRGRVRPAAVALAPAVALVVALSLAPIRAAVPQLSSQAVESLSIPTALGNRSFLDVSIRSGADEDAPPFDLNEATGRFVAKGTLGGFIAFAYSPIPTVLTDWPLSELPETRLRGGPDWLHRDRFTIEATVARPVTEVDLQVMMRRLLLEQFDLFVRLEQEQVQAYRVVRDRADGASAPGLVAPAGLATAQDSCSDRFNMEGGGPGRIVRRCTTLPLLAAGFTLAEVLGRPVVDRTGLAGRFDVVVTYAPTRDELDTIWEMTPAEVPPEYLARPSIFAAFEQQLGLRLEETRAIRDTLIVDSATRPAGAR